MEEFFECYLPLTMDDYNYYQGYALEKTKKLKYVKTFQPEISSLRNKFRVK